MPIVTNYNYGQHLQYFMRDCLSINDIEFDESNYLITYYLIIEKILQSFYWKNYYKVYNELINKKPLSINDQEFINHVKSQSTLIFNRKSDCKEYLNCLYDNILSDQTIIRSFAYHSFNDNTITSDLIIGAMDRAWSSYQSYWALKRKNIKCNRPNYLDKDGLYTLSFYGKTKTEIDGKIKLSTGKFIKKNICEITGKQYNFELIINIPEKLKDKKIKLIEINPIYNGHKFKLNFIYEVPKTSQSKPKKHPIDEMISIDLGLVNLMTIYDPTGYQYIIKGSKLIAVNEYFNKQISGYQSTAIKINKRYTTRRIHNLLIKRKNKLDAYFNKIVSILYEKYRNKKIIIIGYNDGWKTKVNMGTDNNRKFYQIPYRQLMGKIFRKFKHSKVVEIEESYTSKCDALALEKIERHDEYSGKRITRGLFKSGKGVLLNADLNGAINIMRKYCEKTRTKFKQVKGHNLGTPSIIRIAL